MATDTITVDVGDNQPPVVTVISPVDGSASLTTDGIYTDATATDPENNLPFTWTWSSDLDGEVGVFAQTDFLLSRGIHRLTATATDARGGTGSDGVYVIVHDTADQPLVRILDPADGSSFQEGTPVTLTALAHDLTDGSLGASVEWLVDGFVQGFGATYDHTFPENGTFTVTARVQDAFGNTATDSITLVITDPPPTFVIYNPVDGGVYSTLYGVFFSSEARDGTLIPDAPTWSSDLDGVLGIGTYFSADLSPGVHVLTATATGFTGVEGSTSITITVVDAAPPTIYIDAPADLANVPKSQVAFASTFTVDPAATASLQWISSVDGLISTAEDFVAASLTPGVHKITARLIDSFEQMVEAEIDIIVADNDAPVVTILAPADGSTLVEGAPTPFQAQVVDEDVGLEQQVSWSSDVQGNLGTGASLTLSNLTLGSHVITASVIDSASFPGSDSITLTVVANTPPSVSITSPAAGSSSVEGESVSFAATATDAEDGDLAASLVWSSDLDGQIGAGATFATTALSVGSHNITASASDSSGAPASDAIPLIVTPNTPPIVVITAPADGTSITEGGSLSFAGTASDSEDGDISAQIQWVSTLDGLLGTGASLSTVLSVGVHSITAEITDSHGADGITGIQVTVTANTPPVVSVTAPAPGSTSLEGQTVLFTATATDAEDGDLSASISWESSLDGPLGSGDSISSAGLSVGIHLISAYATDSHGADGITGI
ncbi:MAG: Ig-like domain-containing protein, partial [Holophagales bacterium]|nr:Ig-like domain-containing protein [Holophagales bacterium]